MKSVQRGYIKTNTRSYIPTPKTLLNRNAIINPQNKDDKCFLYAIPISAYYDEIDKSIYKLDRVKIAEYLKIY